jgi:hypothetical protein
MYLAVYLGLIGRLAGAFMGLHERTTWTTKGPMAVVQRNSLPNKELQYMDYTDYRISLRWF